MSSYRAIDSTLPSSELERTKRQLGEFARLNPGHRTVLKQQGLSDREIDGIGFVSLERLSEIDKNGSTRKNQGDLFGSTDGVIGIPCYGKNGQIHGYQIWSDESNAAVAGKFFWPPGELPNRLSNGEPPLNYARPEQLQDSTIALCSGILKSHLVAHQLGRIAIGAEGGLFHRCPRQMKRFLGQLRGQLVIYPDPGELLDPQAMQRWREQVNFIGKRLRRKVVFAWWGQIRPEDGELVELEPEKVDKITYLTPEEFWLLANQGQRQAKIKQIQQSLRSLGECQPHSRFNERYLPSLSEQLPRSGIVALKSPKGTGKSVQIANIIRSWQTHKRGIVFSTTPRRALGREQSRRWGLTWAGDGDVSLKGLKAFSLCLDSLWKVEKIDFRRALIVIDEVELALMHLLLSSTCRERRSQLLRVLELKLTECLNSGGLLLIADADLTDLAISYFRALIPKAPLFLIENDCQS
jgi:hypothetical protein